LNFELHLDFVFGSILVIAFFEPIRDRPECHCAFRNGWCLYPIVTFWLWI